MSVLPLVLMQNLVYNSARANVEKETIYLSEGLLASTQDYLDHIFRQGEAFLQVIKNDPPQEFLVLSSQSHLRLADFKKYFFPFLTIDEIYFFSLGSNPRGIRVRPGEFTQNLDAQRLRDRDTLELLKEHPDEIFWLGQLPFFPEAKKTLWGTVVLETPQGPYLAALGISPDLIMSILRRLQSRVDSHISLITQDNTVFSPSPLSFFQQSYASGVLARGDEGPITNFIHQEGEEELLIQVYTHPRYLYNLVSVKNRADLVAPVNKSIHQSNIILGVVSIFLNILALLIVFRLSSRFDKITTAIAQVGSGNYNLTIAPQILGITEVEEIFKGVQLMAAQLRGREKELAKIRQDLETLVEERTTKLKQSMSSLEETQEFLLQSEKMAALGRSFASFTHEVNTPISIGLSAASVLENVMQEMEKNLNIPKEFLAPFNESLDLVVKNLHNAAEITGSLSHLAVGHSLEEPRPYNLKAYLEEVIFTLRPKLKQKKIKIRLYGSEEINLYGDPTVLYQIFSNLIINTIAHGYEDQESEGEIDIDVGMDHKRKDLVKIVYKDYGQGMNMEQLDKIYEPFYTTKKGRGGTGLGMNIVYNLVSKSLQGIITCQSAPGQGVVFTILFPKNLTTQQTLENQEKK